MLILGSECLGAKLLVANVAKTSRALALALKNRFRLWIASACGLDYVNYVKTKACWLNMLLARQTLHAIGVVLRFNFRSVWLNVFDGRFRLVLSSVSDRFVKKILWLAHLSKPGVVGWKCANVIMLLFGVCLFLLNMRIGALIFRSDSFKAASSVLFACEASQSLSLSLRKLLFNVWCLRPLSLGRVCKFASLGLGYSCSAFKLTSMIAGLGVVKLLGLRATYFVLAKRLTNLVASVRARTVLSDGLGLWRILSKQTLAAFGLLTSSLNASMLFEWCNLFLVCCNGLLYCLSFYKIVGWGGRVGLAKLFLRLLANLKLWLNIVLNCVANAC
ncbi:MAG: hypothetical protein P3M75_00055 [Candidatus Hodgkinia cicadicola]|nr:MAG: hypothetical protein P3M75_00055 [Candidatus Hodgkinia cicadicola]